jgi:hypothetical protein
VPSIGTLISSTECRNFSQSKSDHFHRSIFIETFGSIAAILLVALGVELRGMITLLLNITTITVTSDVPGGFGASGERGMLLAAELR